MIKPISLYNYLLAWRSFVANILTGLLSQDGPAYVDLVFVALGYWKLASSAPGRLCVANPGTTFTVRQRSGREFCGSHELDSNECEVVPPTVRLTVRPVKAVAEALDPHPRSGHVLPEPRGSACRHGHRCRIDNARGWLGHSHEDRLCPPLSRYRDATPRRAGG